MDAQGFSVVTPYLESANVTFKTVIDKQNLLGEMLRFNAIPNGLLIDSEGIVNYQNFGSFDIKNPDIFSLIQGWLFSGTNLNLDGSILPKLDPVQQANSLFREGLSLIQEGNFEEALKKWREGSKLDSGNQIIKKQIWAVENPSKFYSGAVDYDWQSKQD